MTRKHAKNQSRNPVVFNLSKRRVFIPDQKMLESLQACASALGDRIFTQREYDAWGRGVVQARSIMKRFFSWRRSLWLAGIGRPPHQKYTPAELMDILERTWVELGRAPGMHPLRDIGGVTVEPFRQRWGSLTNACERLASFHAGNISREELLQQDNARRPRTSIRPSTRWQVLARDNHRCQSCGRSSSEPGVKLEVDHIKPVCAGGNSKASNLRTLCFDCNRGRGNGEAATRDLGVRSETSSKTPQSRRRRRAA